MKSTAHIRVLSELPESGAGNLRQHLERAGIICVSSPTEGWDWLSAIGDRCALVPWMQLHLLPAGNRYRLILLRRNLGEIVVARLARMAARGMDPLPAADQLLNRMQRHFRALWAALDRSSHIEVMHVDHVELAADLEAVTQRALAFFAAGSGIRSSTDQFNADPSSRNLPRATPSP